MYIYIYILLPIFSKIHFNQIKENCKQRVILNGQTSEWKKINSEAPQGLVSGLLLFVIYINNLPDGITSICKIFADRTSLFSKVLDVNEPTKKLNFDIKKISEWAFQWKTQFNPDSNKQANEDIFPRKSKVHSYSALTFNNNDVKKCPHQKYLGIILDSKLGFNIHVDNKIIKCYKMIGIIKRLSLSVSRKALLMEISYMINQQIKIFKIRKIRKSST